MHIIICIYHYILQSFFALEGKRVRPHKKDQRLRVLKDLFASKKITSFQVIVESIKCPEITIRRDLRDLEAITSFSHQRRFLTLPDIPTFDENGIWFYEDIGFSRYRDSLALIVEIINNSENGMSRESIEEILGIKIFQQIQTLLARSKLNRVKVGNRYIYLPEQMIKEKKRRVELFGTQEVEEYHVGKIKVGDLIAVLKALLAENMIDMDDLGKVIRKYSLNLTVQKIELITQKYDLDSKKNR